ncbi:MAG: type II toxin-antitoxin system RelE/ParE family toxin [Victivallaceae bacterium]|nr:type II toxin-antitoxin system RelE/ParE family toxin [Victivallaceae bacterium]
MIKSFKHKGLKRYWEKDNRSGIQNQHVPRLRKILVLLNAANIIEDVNLAGLRLHQLNPKKNNIWSVTVSGNWRVTFKFEDGNVFIIDYLDYH